VYSRVPEVEDCVLRGIDLLVDGGAGTSRGCSFALLFLIYNIAFVLSPYWLLPPKAWQRAVLLTFIAAAGTAWAWLSSGPAGFAVREPLGLLLVGIPVVALNTRALVAGIPWFGDEGFHIGSTIALVNPLIEQPLIPVGLAVIAAGFVWATRRLKFFGIRVALICAGLIAAEIVIVAGLRLVAVHSLPYERLGGRTSILPDRSFADYSILRYPYFVRWCSALPVVLLSPFMDVTPPLAGYFTEAAYRLVPLLSAVSIAWAVWRRMSGQPVVRWLLALAVGTTPLLVYYSSTLYLELPAALLMTVVLFDAERLLTGSPEELRVRPSWYALILIGFVKETTVPFLLAFLLCRLAGRARGLRMELSSGRTLLAEAMVVFGVLFPLAAYLFFRELWAETRAYVAVPVHLRDPRYYTVLLHSYAQQFGPLGLLAAGGLIVLLARRRFLVLLFLATAFFGDAAFHFLDQVQLIGYSRFNLFILPVVVVAATYAIQAVPHRFWPASALLATCVICANLWLSPLYADGTKVTNWGDYGFDQAGHYYPYREAVRWLARYHAQNRILVTGLDYSPGLYLYAPRSLRITLRILPFDRRETLGMPPSDDPAKVTDGLAAAARDGFDVVLYHVWGADASIMPRPAGWRLATVISNRAHCLVVYERRSTG
jgi:hypothetical protein